MTTAPSQSARRHRAAIARILVVALTACSTTGPPAAPNFLHVLETEVARGTDLARPLRVAARSRKVSAIASLFDPRLVSEVDDDEIVLELRRYPLLVEDPIDASAYLQPSFVIDFDRPAVEDWARALLQEVESGRPTPEQISAFVESGLEASGPRSFDFASRVARKREGDCTEHAVLFAALARRFGYPARVTLGTVLVAEGDGALQAYGHAWNEVVTPEGWRLFDATGIGRQAIVWYIPTGHLTNEGPGYARTLTQQLMNGVQSIRVLGNVEPER